MTPPTEGTAESTAESTGGGDDHTSSTLPRLPLDRPHTFVQPSKRIHDGADLAFFLTSRAYADIMTWLLQLNAAMFPRHCPDPSSSSRSRIAQTWELDAPDVVPFPAAIQSLRTLLGHLDAIIDRTPPDPGPRRFGNVAFRTWHRCVLENLPELLDHSLPPQVLGFPATAEGITPRAELQAYLEGAFGSPQRLDYGTGHELSFLAFLGGLWKLGAFAEGEERAIVIGVVEPYLRLVRRLILTYTLEPAGSHGVWGLDDHSFLPYIFGSAQLGPPVTGLKDIPTEGSIANAPDPGDVAKAAVVARERARNMYFSAIGFIYDVKKGPFWEHSPILFDISGVKAGWAKINKGMIKMYNAEVLGKFPVVQHFPFGSLFLWEHDPAVPSTGATTRSVHTVSQPTTSARIQQTPLRDPMLDRGIPNPQPTTAAPWATGRAGSTMPSSPGQFAGFTPEGRTSAPWAHNASGSSSSASSTRAPRLDRRSLVPGAGPAAAAKRAAALRRGEGVGAVEGALRRELGGPRLEGGAAAIPMDAPGRSEWKAKQAVLEGVGEVRGREGEEEGGEWMRDMGSDVQRASREKEGDER